MTFASAKWIIIKKGHFPAESRSYESNDIIGQNRYRGGNLRQKELDEDCKIAPQKPPPCIERDPKKRNTNSRRTFIWEELPQRYGMQAVDARCSTEPCQI